jgi:outer membrane lipoprotein-sorting protein
MTTKLLLVLAATSLTLSSATVAKGADAAQTKTADSSSQTAAQDKGVTDAAADQVVQKFSQFYRQLKSFSLTLESDEEMKAEEKSLKIHQTCQMKLERPNRVFARAEEPTVTQNLLTPSEVASAKVTGWTVLKSNGKTIWMYKSDQNKYSKAKHQKLSLVLLAL